MSWLGSVEDRYLVLVILILLIVAYWAMKDPFMGDLAKIMLGSFVTLMVTRSEKTIIVGDAEAKKVIEEMVGTK